MESVDLLVVIVESSPLGAAVLVGQRRRLPHSQSGVAHLLDDSTAQRTHHRSQAVGGSLSDMFRQIGASFELGQNEQEPDQVA